MFIYSELLRYLSYVYMSKKTKTAKWWVIRIFKYRVWWVIHNAVVGNSSWVVGNSQFVVGNSGPALTVDGENVYERDYVM